MKLDKSAINEVEHDINPPMGAAITIRVSGAGNVAVYVAASPFQPISHADLQVVAQRLSLADLADRDAAARLALLQDAAQAAIRYDEAIQACADDPEKMASHCTAQNETLDVLYAAWISKARAALAGEKSQERRPAAGRTPLTTALLNKHFLILTLSAVLTEDQVRAWTRRDEALVDLCGLLERRCEELAAEAASAIQKGKS